MGASTRAASLLSLQKATRALRRAQRAAEVRDAAAVDAHVLERQR
jgi:hypothetical protein